MRELRKYSLVHRNPVHKLLSLHRLLQVLMKDDMDEDTQRLWAERAVRALNKAFPEAKFTTWPLCKRYLPHARICATLIRQTSMTFPKAALLLYKAGDYLLERARYSEVRSFLQQALALRERYLGQDHPQTADSLDRLVWLHENQANYLEAELLYRRALAIREQQLGAHHSDTACSFDNLAGLYYAQGKYTEAEPSYQRALAIREQQLGADHPRTAQSLNNLGSLYAAGFDNS